MCRTTHSIFSLTKHGKSCVVRTRYHFAYTEIGSDTANLNQKCYNIYSVILCLNFWGITVVLIVAVKYALTSFSAALSGINLEP